MSSGRKGRSGPNKGKKKGLTLGRALMRDRKKKPRSHREKARMRMLYNHTTETVTFFYENAFEVAQTQNTKKNRMEEEMV